GEFLTLLGPSGCGKTTVLRLIAGLESVDSGQIHLEDHDITHIPAENRHVNTVFQSYALFPHMTVFENVAFGLRMQKTPTVDIAPRVHDALRMVQLEAFAQRKPHQLSGGQQQRVAIARAVVNKPAVLLADEPTGNLDEALSEGILRLFEEFNRVGVTVLMATHDLGLISSRPYRVLSLSEGHMHGGHIGE
ncbi:ATP-binding cassette domain-containing protein, partial [Burkholderia multivorans]|uniref:ATP-binding cassette domain-containing protein n=1 Tax=Burkholderia multivorans TaxID=87883 RepID=UPI001E46374E